MKIDVICISVGAFTAAEAKGLIENTQCIVSLCVFEPNPDARLAYNETFKDYENVTIRPEAVGSQHSTADFYLCGQSSSLKTDKECDKIEVKIVPLTWVISEFVTCYQNVKSTLMMNCEGSEIDIIENTPIEVFKVFEVIYIEFHPHVSMQEEIERCIDKLASAFDFTITYGSVSKHPRYSFRKRE